MTADHYHAKQGEFSSKLPQQSSKTRLKMPHRSQYLGLDCEMVGDLKGQSFAARVVLVNWFGMIIFDEYIKPDVQVTDYRTFVSGITEQDLQDKGLPIDRVCSKVLALVQNKIVVGHGLPNDLACLGIEHPWYLQRDTAFYEPFMQKRPQNFPSFGTGESSCSATLLMPRKLRDLAREKLSRDIQVPGRPHCPAEDAIAALDLYKLQMDQWECCLQTQFFQMVQRQQDLQCQQIQYQLRIQQLQRMALQEQYAQFYFYPQDSQIPQYKPPPPPPRRRRGHSIHGHQRRRRIRAVAPQPEIHA